MLHCKHCGFFSTEEHFLKDQWEYTICPKCGGEDIIEFEEQCKIEMINKNNNLSTRSSAG
tara:strand:- start:4917 stop:5096 length:180 start_codon:yes stop_codon:yes gene_type:complete